MPMYRISGETHERLKLWAVPLSDTRDDVVRRVLDVAEGKAVEMESESLHFHTRSRLAVAIEEFLTGEHLLTANPSDMAPRLAEHILSTWMNQIRTYTVDKGGEENADRPDAG